MAVQACFFVKKITPGHPTHRFSGFLSTQFPGFHPGAQHFDDGGKDRDDDDGDDEQLEVMLYERQVSEKVACIAEQRHPGGSADQVEQHEAGVMHSAHSGDERCESTDDGHEPRENDGFAAVFFVERLRLVYVALLENPGIRIAEEPAAEEVADHVVAGVAGYGGGEEDQHEEVYFERHAGQGRNSPCDEQQRVAGQERGDDQPGFAEDDEEQDGVCPQVVVLDDTDEVLIDMQNEIQQKLHKLLCVLKVMERISLRPERGGGDGRVRMAALNAHAFQHVDIITVGIPEMGGFADVGRGVIPGKGPAGDTAHSGCHKDCRRPEIRGEAGPERKERGRGVGPGVFRKGTICPVCGGGVFRPVDHGVRAVGRGNGRTFAGGESGQQRESQ